MSAVIQNKSERDPRVEAAISHWAPRFVANGVPLADFQEVTASVSRWEDWCAAWSARAAVHEEMGNKALAGGYNTSAAAHFTRAAEPRALQTHPDKAKPRRNRPAAGKTRRP